MQISFDFNSSSNDKPSVKGKGEKVPSKRGRKSLKALTQEAAIIDIPSDEELSKKLYHSISEVSEMFGVNPSLLRYWETEFRQINPRKNKKGDRYYTLADIKTIQLIHFLLRQRKYTIEGAKDYLKKHKDEAAARYTMVEKLQQLKSFLLSLKADL